MFKFTGSFKKLEFDLVGANQAFKEALADQIRQAMREFLQAAIPKVPVYTGQAMATLRPLGRYLSVAIPISPTAAAKRKHAGTGPGTGELLGSYIFEQRGFLNTITLTNDLFYFTINDFYGGGIDNLKNPAPWGAIESGRKAYIEYLRANLKKKVPKVLSYLTRTPVDIG